MFDVAFFCNWIIGPYLFDSNLNGQRYRHFLEFDLNVPILLYDSDILLHARKKMKYFQQEV